MSNRALRRAAERQALKMAANANSSNTAAAPAATAPQISDARLAANRANALHSTGATTPEGRAVSSLNALKTGLTGRTVLLSSDDTAAYQAHVARHISQYSPVGDEERALVQTIADTEWRLLRIFPLETAIYALGERKLADQFLDESNPELRRGLIHAQILIDYRRDLGNLALQERRLRNQRTADIAQLCQLQEQRQAEENESSPKPPPAKAAAASAASGGFEFSALPSETDLPSTDTAPGDETEAAA